MGDVSDLSKGLRNRWLQLIAFAPGYRTARSNFPEKSLDRVGDSFHLRFTELRINRQAQALSRRFLSYRKITLFVTELRVTFLHVQRQRVMHRATDAFG